MFSIMEEEALNQAQWGFGQKDVKIIGERGNFNKYNSELCFQSTLGFS